MDSILLSLKESSRYLSQQQTSLFPTGRSHLNLFMAKYYSKSILQRELPQYAYALAILSGGSAYIVSQLVTQRIALFSYALLAALFASIWPYKALQWGVWLCLPVALLVCIDVIATGNLVGVVLGSGIMFAKTLSFACLGAYLGSKLSIRKIANRLAHRKRLKSQRKSAESNPLLKEPATPHISVKTISASQSDN
ncbi:MAG TPA: hypothetical protein VGC64_03495, partial [Pyrinomonadaceae bacterium]